MLHAQGRTQDRFSAQELQEHQDQEAIPSRSRIYRAHTSREITQECRRGEDAANRQAGRLGSSARGAENNRFDVDTFPRYMTSNGHRLDQVQLFERPQGRAGWTL